MEDGALEDARDNNHTHQETNQTSKMRRETNSSPSKRKGTKLIRGHSAYSKW